VRESEGCQESDASRRATDHGWATVGERTQYLLSPDKYAGAMRKGENTGVPQNDGGLRDSKGLRETGNRKMDPCSFAKLKPNKRGKRRVGD